MKFNYNKKLPTISAWIFFVSSVLISSENFKNLYHRFFESYFIIFYFAFAVSLAALIFFWEEKKITTKRFFLFTLAPEIALLVGTQTEPGMHYVFNILIAVWIFALGYSLIIKRHKKNNKKKKELVIENKTESKKTVLMFVAIFLTTVISVHFLFSIFDLDKEAYSDERLWTYSGENRIEDYWKNVKARDWIKTRPSDKPGVTLAIISGIGLIWETPSEFFNNAYNKQALLHMLFVMRLPVVIFDTLILLVFFFVIKKLTETRTALAATAFIALSPILIGISQIINPDALIYVFMPLSLLCYLVYDRKSSLFWLYLSGIFLGLGLLTKYISNLLIIFFFFSIFTSFILKEKKDKKIATFIREKLLDYATLIFIAITVFYIFYPGTWVKLDRILIGTIWSEPFLPIWKFFVLFIAFVIADLIFLKSRIIGWILEIKRKFRFLILLFVPITFLLASLFAFWNTYQGMSVIDFQAGLSSPKSYWRDASFGSIQAFLAGFYVLLFSISPVASLGLLSGLFLSIWNILKKNISWRVIVFWQISLFCIIYYAGSGYSLVGPIIRYQIIIYPLAFVLSGIGIIWLAETLAEQFFKKSKYQKKVFSGGAILLVIIFQIFTLWNIKPFFFSYNSELLPEPFIINPKDMGDGNYKAAEFLNSMPDAQKLNVWSDNDGVCALFVGKCTSTISRSKFIKEGPYFDYYIISNGRKERSTRTILHRLSGNKNYNFRLDRLYETPDFLFEITPGNRKENFIRVIDGDAVVVYEKEN